MKFRIVMQDGRRIGSSAKSQRRARKVLNERRAKAGLHEVLGEGELLKQIERRKPIPDRSFRRKRKRRMRRT